MRTQLPRWTAAVLILALPLSGACKSNREGAAPAGTQTGMQNQPPPPDTSMTPPNPAGATGDTARGGASTVGNLSDANIMALLDEANKADSSAGAVAVKKATNPQVKAFGRQMMNDHHGLRLRGEKLAKQLKISPEPPTNDPLAPGVQDETNSLQSTPKGPEFDRTYIEKEVSAHQAVKDLLDQAHRSTQNDQLRKLIEGATPVVQSHLDRAQELQKELTKSA